MPFRAVVMAVGLTFLGTGTALAGDWSGFYGGVAAGYQFTDADWTLEQNAGNEISGQIGNVLTSNSGNGFVGGVQVGYNRQWDNIVAGVEAEISAMTSDSYSTWANQAGLFRDASADYNWFAALSGRAGFVFNEGRNLAFGKIGIAAVGADYVHTGGPAGNPRRLVGDGTSVGILFGAGIEHEISQKTLLRFEYDYINLPSDSISFKQGNRTAIFGINQDIHTVRAGIYFRFGS